MQVDDLDYTKVPGKTAYRVAEDFDNAIEQLEVNCGCKDYFAHGFQAALDLAKNKLDKLFEEYGMEDARNILENALIDLES